MAPVGGWGRAGEGGRQAVRTGVVAACVPGRHMLSLLAVTAH